MKTTLTSLLIFSFHYLMAQTAPGIQWQNTIGGGILGDVLMAAEPTTDGGYILGGYTNAGISGDKTEPSQGGFDYWVVKLDASGNIEWQNDIGGSGDDFLYSIDQAADGGYILGGYSSSGISGDKTEANLGVFGYPDYWIVKLGHNGNIQWQNTIGGTETDHYTHAMATSDDGCIVGGTSVSGVSGDKTEACLGGTDYWVVKLDGSGTIEWQNTIGGNGNDALNWVEPVAGGYILAGGSYSDLSGDKTEHNVDTTYPYSKDCWIVKLDGGGNIEWQNTIGGSGDDDVYCIKPTSDGGYIMGAISRSGISGDKTEGNLGLWDYWVVKLDAGGNIIWQNTIGGSADDVLWSVEETTDGGYILGGFSLSNISNDKTESQLGGGDYWVVKIDGNGNILWQNTIGGSALDQLMSVQQTDDGGYFLAGYSSSPVSADKTEASNGIDYWVVKLEPPPCIVSASITPSGTVSICKGATVNLTANAGAGFTYEWFKNGIIIPGANNQIYSTTKGGNYTVRVSTSSVCSATSAPAIVKLLPVPVATITPLGNLDICATGSVVLQANSGAGFSYQWQKGNNILSGQTNQNYTATSKGTYKVVVKGSNGCSKTSAGTKVTKSCKEDFTGSAEAQLTLYPNPTNGNFMIDLQLSEELQAENEAMYEDAVIEIFNALGQMVMSENATISDGILLKEIKMGANSVEGIYFVRVRTGDKIFLQQLTCQQ